MVKPYFKTKHKECRTSPPGTSKKRAEGEEDGLYESIKHNFPEEMEKDEKKFWKERRST